MAKTELKTLERIYVIPLRKEFLKTPKWKRSKKSVNIIQKFVMRHMKVEKVLIGKELNEKIWERGSENPPSKIKVRCIKTENKCTVNLFDLPIKKNENKKEKQKKEETSKMKDENKKEEKNKEKQDKKKTSEKKNKVNK